jgi:hypothetical protein
MSDYAHGEQRQIARWFDADGIGAAHSDAETVALLQALDIYAVLCLAGLYDLAGLATEPCASKMAEVISVSELPPAAEPASKPPPEIC